MPPINRPGPPQDTPATPEQRLLQLLAQRARLKGAIGSDEDYAEIQAQQTIASDANRVAQKEQLAKIEEQIEELKAE